MSKPLKKGDRVIILKSGYNDSNHGKTGVIIDLSGLSREETKMYNIKMDNPNCQYSKTWQYRDGFDLIPDPLPKSSIEQAVLDIIQEVRGENQ